jgi:hypothetical protein
MRVVAAAAQAYEADVALFFVELAFVKCWAGPGYLALDSFPASYKYFLTFY